MTKENINYTRKDTLLNVSQKWIKRNVGLFDVTMVSMIERKVINLQIPFDLCFFAKI